MPFDVVAATSSVLIALIAWRGYFQFDDFLLLYLGKTSRLTPSYLTTSIFGHLIPGEQLLDYLMIRHLGFHHEWFLLVAVSFHLGAALAFVYLLRILCVRPGLRALLVCVYSLTPLWYSSISLWVSAAQSMPVDCFGLIAVGQFVRHNLEPRWWRLWIALLCYLTALSFHELGLFVGPAAIGICILIWLTGWPLGSRIQRLPETSVLVALVVITYLVFYTGFGYGSHGSVPRIPALLALYLDAFTASLATALVGGPMNWANGGVGIADPALPVILMNSGLVVIFGVITILRNPRSALWYGLALAFFGVQVGIIAYGRLDQYGPHLARELRYVANLAWLFLMAAGVAGSISRKPIRIAWAMLALPSAPPSTRLLQIVALGLFLTQVGISAQGYEQIAAGNRAKPYLANVATSLAEARRSGANPGIPGGSVPPEVIPAYFAPYSYFERVFLLAGITLPQDLVGHDPYVVRPDGRVVPAIFRPISSTIADASSCLAAASPNPSIPLALPPANYVVRVEMVPGAGQFVRPFIRGGGGEFDLSSASASRASDNFIAVPPSGVLLVAAALSPVDTYGVALPPGSPSCVRSIAVGVLVPA